MSGKNFSPEQLLRLLQNSRSEQDNQNLAEDVFNNQLSPEQKQRIEAVLRDKDALNRLLAGEQAQKLMKRFGKKP
ncbi:MAG: hypothetical protein IKH12_06695 [Clostridia bacterium]|nr:hypothetical protein [Clostridia bacterium]